jgi:hypothetical protein
MPTEDDEYFDRVQELSKRHDSDGPDERFRQMAREEANKRIEAYLGPLVLLGLLVGAIHLYGATGGWLVGGIAVAWFLWSVVKMDWDPAYERHLIVMKAEDLNRLRVITDAHAAGEPVWRIHEKEYERDTKKIETVDGPRWDGSWKRIYHDALELQALSPRKRRAKVEKAAQAARSALLDGKAMAKRENAELTFWASGHIQKLEQR